ncbi:MAG: hypothetical protein ACHREM_00145 [Polyangiales bacterium]
MATTPKKCIDWNDLPRDAAVWIGRGNNTKKRHGVSWYEVRLRDGSRAYVDSTGEEASAAWKFLEARVKATLEREHPTKR